MDFMNLNQVAHGDREFGYIQSRLSTSRKTIAGHVTDLHTRRRIGSWVGAALGNAELSTLKVARSGDNMRGVAVTEGDKVEAEAHFGASIDTYGVNDLVDVVERVRPADVDKLVQEYEHTYRISAELLPGGDRHESLRHGAQIEIGLRKFLLDGDFHAFTTNFEDLGGLRQLPGLAVQRLMAEGYGFGGEGDWKIALMLRTVKVMAGGLPGGTSFMADYTYDLTPGRERILGAHMLEVCPSIASGTDAGSASAIDRRSRRSGPAALHGGTRRCSHHRHLRHGEPIPAGGQRSSSRRSAGRAAEPAGRVCRLGTLTVLVHKVVVVVSSS
jgi:L-arabinose isomerase